MEENVLNIFLRVRERFDELDDRVSLLETYFELHISSPGMAKTLEEFKGMLGFEPKLIYRSKEYVYAVSVVYTIDDVITKGIMAHEFAELVAREKGVSDHEAIDHICFEKGFGQELLLALESVLPGRVERAFIDPEDLKTRITKLREKIEKNEA